MMNMRSFEAPKMMPPLIASGKFHEREQLVSQGQKLIQPREHVQSLLQNPNLILCVQTYCDRVSCLCAITFRELYIVVMLKASLSFSLGYRKGKSILLQEEDILLQANRCFIMGMRMLLRFEGRILRGPSCLQLAEYQLFQ